jgi:hypothetical protein
MYHYGLGDEQPEPTPQQMEIARAVQAALRSHRPIERTHGMVAAAVGGAAAGAFGAQNRRLRAALLGAGIGAFAEYVAVLLMRRFGPRLIGDIGGT